ncbi:unnamed protein product [Amoebophrya sp. A25]|nr:unnamed protein product [Amoebophrya sp. A25]|eukprot:GSA25T00025372001.1
MGVVEDHEQLQERLKLLVQSGVENDRRKCGEEFVKVVATIVHDHADTEAQMIRRREHPRVEQIAGEHVSTETLAPVLRRLLHLSSDEVDTQSFISSFGEGCVELGLFLSRREQASRGQQDPAMASNINASAAGSLVEQIHAVDYSRYGLEPCTMQEVEALNALGSIASHRLRAKSPKGSRESEPDSAKGDQKPRWAREYNVYILTVTMFFELLIELVRVRGNFHEFHTELMLVMKRIDLVTKRVNVVALREDERGLVEQKFVAHFEALEAKKREDAEKKRKQEEAAAEKKRLALEAEQKKKAAAAEKEQKEKEATGSRSTSKEAKEGKTTGETSAGSGEATAGKDKDKKEEAVASMKKDASSKDKDESGAAGQLQQNSTNESTTNTSTTNTTSKAAAAKNKLLDSALPEEAQKEEEVTPEQALAEQVKVVRELYPIPGESFGRFHLHANAPFGWSQFNNNPPVDARSLNASFSKDLAGVFNPHYRASLSAANFIKVYVERLQQSRSLLSKAHASKKSTSSTKTGMIASATCSGSRSISVADHNQSSSYDRCAETVTQEYIADALNVLESVLELENKMIRNIQRVTRAPEISSAELWPSLRDKRLAEQFEEALQKAQKPPAKPKVVMDAAKAASAIASAVSGLKEAEHSTATKTTGGSGDKKKDDAVGDAAASSSTTTGAKVTTTKDASNTTTTTGETGTNKAKTARSWDKTKVSAEEFLNRLSAEKRASVLQKFPDMRALQSHLQKLQSAEVSKRKAVSAALAAAKRKKEAAEEDGKTADGKTADGKEQASSKEGKTGEAADSKVSSDAEVTSTTGAVAKRGAAAASGGGKADGEAEEEDPAEVYRAKRRRVERSAALVKELQPRSLRELMQLVSSKRVSDTRSSYTESLTSNSDVHHLLWNVVLPKLNADQMLAELENAAAACSAGNTRDALFPPKSWTEFAKNLSELLKKHLKPLEGSCTSSVYRDGAKPHVPLHVRLPTNGFACDAERFQVQIHSPEFHLWFCVQVIIFFHALENDSRRCAQASEPQRSCHRLALPTTKKPKQTELSQQVAAMRKMAFQILSSVDPNFAKALHHDLITEQFWTNWKRQANYDPTLPGVRDRKLFPRGVSNAPGGNLYSSGSGSYLGFQERFGTALRKRPASHRALLDALRSRPAAPTSLEGSAVKAATDGGGASSGGAGGINKNILVDGIPTPSKVVVPAPVDDFIERLIADETGESGVEAEFFVKNDKVFMWQLRRLFTESHLQEFLGASSWQRKSEDKEEDAATTAGAGAVAGATTAALEGQDGTRDNSISKDQAVAKTTTTTTTTSSDQKGQPLAGASDKRFLELVFRSRNFDPSQAREARPEQDEEDEEMERRMHEMFGNDPVDPTTINKSPPDDDEDAA